MAAPVDAYIQLADDSAFAGPKLRTQTRVVGSNTVHERMITINRIASVLGLYEAGMAQQTVAAAAQDGITSGFVWIHMPTAITGCSARIRRIYFNDQHSTALTTPSSPRVALAKFTFTGTATGATLSPDPDTSYRRAKLDLRTASTGLSVTLVGNIVAIALSGGLSAAGVYTPAPFSTVELYSNTLTAPVEDEYIVIAPGEGVVVYQDIGGVASDTRKLNITVVWDEIDT